MNCEEYRQAIGADPAFDGGAGHLSECEACQAIRREMLELDVKIRDALSIKVPNLELPSLDEAVIDDTAADNVVALDSRRRISTPAWFAVAATVVIAAFVGVRFGGLGGASYDSLAEEVLAHVTHEPAALVPTDKRVTDDKLHRVVPATIAELDRSAGLITYAETCPISGNDVPHLVIQGERGPITIMLLPDEKISAAIPLNDENSHGVILPVGDGSIAIVGSREEKLEEVQKHIVQSVMWDT
jgi:hypothetical protein